MDGRRILVGIALLLAAPADAQRYTSDQIAGSLGVAMAVASMCNRPTAPIEAELERYIKQVGAGPLEANRLRQAMMDGGVEYRRVVTTPNCATADQGIADTIARVRAGSR